MAVTMVPGAEQEKPFETFNRADFENPTHITNPWLPLKPGTRWTWEGTTVDDEGQKEPHKVIFTVTDLTKVIDGIRTVVCWDRDFADGELEEAEIVFFAQDKHGHVWHFGQYPEEYVDGAFVAAPCWIHAVQDGKAGIMMKAEPKLGAPSYSQGLSISTEWTDRAVVHQMGQTKKVPFGEYKDVLVMKEWDQEEPNSAQLKFYARGLGNIAVGWTGEPDTDQEILELVKFEQLSAEELAKAREAALELERNAYQESKETYGRTAPAERMTSSAAGE
jgi:hypothetical protein